MLVTFEYLQSITSKILQYSITDKLENIECIVFNFGDLLMLVINLVL